MTVAPATPLLVRARLRRDRPAQALARILIPQADGARLGAAHSLVWALFADGPDRHRDFLWRETRPGEFLILAARPPVDQHDLFQLEHKPFAPVLRPGQRLGFDLRANPVVSVPVEPGQRGKRRDVVTHALSKIDPAQRPEARERAIAEAVNVWLLRLGDAAGFGVDPVDLHVAAEEWVRIPREHARSIVFSALTLQGVLTVRDPARFVVAVTHGFGAAKAFGCGLMLIRRAS